MTLVNRDETALEIAWPGDGYTLKSRRLSQTAFARHGHVWPQVISPTCLEFLLPGGAQFKVKLFPMWGLIFPA